MDKNLKKQLVILGLVAVPVLIVLPLMTYFSREIYAFCSQIGLYCP